MSISTITDTKLTTLTQLSQGDFAAFLYDCDGTLADTMGPHKASYKAVAEKYGFGLELSIIDELAGWPIIAVAQEIKKRYNANFDPEVFTEEKNRIFEELYIHETKPIDFVVEHLKQHAGKMRIAVVSGSPRSAVDKTLQLIGVRELVEVLVCAGETEHGKPFPDPFLSAAQQLGVEPAKCLVFEDGNAGVQSAEAAGMKWIRVDRI